MSSHTPASSSAEEDAARRERPRRVGRALAVACLALFFFAPIEARAQTLSGAAPEGLDEARFEVSRRTEDGMLVLEGNVELRGGDAVIHADRVVYDEENQIVRASGDVALTFPGALMAGATLVYDLTTNTGEVTDVTAYFEQDGAIMRAESAERVAERTLLVERARFTTCTQPVPYWSFSIRRGRFDLGEYAYLRGVGFKAGRVPLFYTPYLVWPIKTDRASGLLFPDFNTSDKLGTSISLPLYWAFAESADVTFFLEGYTKVGFGLGAELRWLPTADGEATGRAHWIDDQVRDRSRYRYEWEHRQDLRYDIELWADIEAISDYDYWTDYETDLARSSSPRTVSRAAMSKEWSWYTATLNTRRQVQYFVASAQRRSFLTQKSTNDVLPEFELRGRSQKLGSWPLYLSFEASASRFARRIESADRTVFPLGVEDEELLDTVTDNAWLRADVAPRFSLPLIKEPWGDLSIETGLRWTWWSDRTDPDDPQDIVDRDLSRGLVDAALRFAGPRFQRIFETPEWSFSPKLKHVIEPFVDYRYQPEANVTASEIIRVDQIDTVPQELSDVSYGIRQRFTVLRPAQTGYDPGLLAGERTSFDEMERAAREAEKEAENADPEEILDASMEVTEQLNPMEIGSLEIFQTYSFERELTTLFSDDPAMLGEVEALRRYSPITVRGRFNATSDHSMDVAYVYDPGNRELLETRISALLRLSSQGYFQGSWFRRRSPNPAAENESSFLRSRWGFTSLDRRFSIEADLDYDVEDGDLDHQGYLVRYSSQCCTLKLGYDRRDFLDNTREEFYLVVDLTGIGEILDLKTSVSE